MFELIFISLALLAAFKVIASTNPIHSVFYLILVFVSTSFLLFLLHSDFLGFIFLVVYVGAIAVLFLFVVMMLNLHYATFNDNLFRYLPIGFFIGFFFLFHLFLLLDSLYIYPILLPSLDFTIWNHFITNHSQLHLFGDVLYSVYLPYFLIASLILFVAMVGAIVLTTHPTHAVKRQDINLQISRDFHSTIILA